MSLGRDGAKEKMESSRNNTDPGKIIRRKSHTWYDEGPTLEEERIGSSKSRCNSSGLGLGATAFGRNVATAATGSETTTAVTLETTAALATGTVTATTTSTSTTSTTTATGREAVAAVGVAAGAALFNEDLLAANLVGVGSNSSSVASGLVELNKGAVLIKELILIKSKD
jgi:hypothetical protein